MGWPGGVLEGSGWGKAQGHALAHL
jgi:hypothetical protein